MDAQRQFLTIALLVVSFFLYQKWQEDYHPQPQTPAQQAQSGQTPSTGAVNPDLPASSDLPTSSQDNLPASVSVAERFIKVRTNVVALTIDSKGGDIVEAELLNYPVNQGEPDLVKLLADYHLAQSGLIGANGPDASKKGRPQYKAEQLSYDITTGEQVISLKWRSPEGLLVSKNFTIKADEYDIKVTYNLTNQTGNVQSVQPFGQLKKVILAPESSLMMNAYNQATYSTKEERYEKYDQDDMADRALNKNTMGGWVAMQQHYFVAAWVPKQAYQNNIYSRIASDGSAIIGFKGPVFNIQPGDVEVIETTLYAGPKVQEKLGQLSETLELTVDYGPLWFISLALFWLMEWLYSTVFANWGVAIILVTIIVKTLLYPLTKKQTVSMAKMRALQPKLQALKERYGDDRAKMGPAMMELYKKEQVNPMGGCLPLLLQMPIFLALVLDVDGVG